MSPDRQIAALRMQMACCADELENLLQGVALLEQERAYLHKEIKRLEEGRDDNGEIEKD